MEFKLMDIMSPSRSMRSVEAERGAERLVERLENGKMGMEVMPNVFKQFTGELEERDFQSYCRFLESANGYKVIQMLEEEDARKLFEL